MVTTIPVNITPNQVDLSQLDTIAGAVGGAVVVMIVMFIVGIFLVKYRIVNFGGATNKDYIADALKTVQRTLEEMKIEMKEYSETQVRCQKELPIAYIPRHDLEKILEEIKSRQVRLREEVLPRDYVRKEELRDLTRRIDAIDAKLDTLLYRSTKENN